MRLKLLAIVATIVMIGFGGQRALASITGPEQGEPQAISNVEGDEIATMTVTDLQDPFEEFSEFGEPEEGVRYVLVTVEIENTGERPFEFSPFDIYVRDTLGHTWGDTFVSVEEDFEEENPPLEDRNMSSDETHSGVLYFAVPEDVELSDVMYQSNANDTSVLYSIADLAAGESPDDADADADADAPADDEETEEEDSADEDGATPES